MTQRIIPALLSQSLTQLRSDVRSLHFAHELQIDLVDGKYVPFAAWPYEPAGDPAEIAPYLANHSIEVDLMVKEQLTAAKRWAACGAETIIFHAAGVTPTEVANFADQHTEVGIAVALTNDIPLAELEPYIPLIERVQLMGIAEIGAQGMPFDERVLERIKNIRKQYPDLTISIDGSMNEETITQTRQAGADRLVVGSALLQATDREAQFATLNALAQ